jgi:hypothetical protein
MHEACGTPRRAAVYQRQFRSIYREAVMNTSHRRVGMVVFTALLSALLLAPSSAWAGGPTSVLLVSPSAGRSAALYYSDSAYTQLETLLNERRELAPTAVGDEHAIGDYITVTWLIHDVSIWRVDRIYLGAPGGPWVATQSVIGDFPGPTSSAGPGPSLDIPAVWHAVSGRAPLTALLAKVGLLGTSPVASSASALAPTVAAPAPGTTPLGSASEVSTSAGHSSVWLWAIAGLVLGAFGTLLIGQFTQRIAGLQRLNRLPRLNRLRRWHDQPDTDREDAAPLATEIYLDIEEDTPHLSR